jgi:23S rRNA (cytosine1962-C5)-methyltransferase
MQDTTEEKQVKDSTIINKEGLHIDVFSSEWKEYELIDCGRGAKIERFGKYTLIRPEPQALWDSMLSAEEWRRQADAEYQQTDTHAGEWKILSKRKIPNEWSIAYQLSNEKSIRFQLQFTKFKHLGVFPEQAVNWEFLVESLKDIPDAKVLNLFAYTGGASLAAKTTGADVIHLDSVKSVINWASKNQEISGLKDIRWLIEDAMLFVQREAKRGRKYNAIIMDPPSYGLGPKGERWKLEDMLDELFRLATELLFPENFCFIVNTYSLNLSPVVLYSLLNKHKGKLNPTKIEIGEIVVPSASGLYLPLGAVLRVKG